MGEAEPPTSTVLRPAYHSTKDTKQGQPFPEKYSIAADETSHICSMQVCMTRPSHTMKSEFGQLPIFARLLAILDRNGETNFTSQPGRKATTVLIIAWLVEAKAICRPIVSLELF